MGAESKIAPGWKVSGTQTEPETSQFVTTGSRGSKMFILADGHEDLAGQLAYKPRGGALKLWQCRDHQVIIHGPAETGKTYGALQKLDALLWKYPKSHAAMVRNQYVDLPASAVRTFEQKVAHQSVIDGKFGGEKPQFYKYPNGSVLRVAGLDRHSKVLSAEFDFIYVNQAEELALEDWQVLTTRCTGRAGNAPYSQIFGDANPGPCSHWMYTLEKQHTVTLIYSKHSHNPLLYDDSGRVTEQGKRTIQVLRQLTGFLKQRLLKGKCGSAVGQVYSRYDPDVHYIPAFKIPDDWERIRVIDFGLVHPFVCAWIAFDEDDRMYVYRQIYMTDRTVATHAKQIIELTGTEEITATICDHDAEDRLTLSEEGIDNEPALKAISIGIDKVTERLRIQKDGRPRLFVFKGSLVEVDTELSEKTGMPYAIEHEFPIYIWANSMKEKPKDLHNHGMDVIRYAAMWKDDSSRWTG